MPIQKRPETATTIRQLIPGVGTPLTIGACEEWTVLIMDWNTRTMVEKYVGTHDTKRHLYQFGGTLANFVCTARGRATNTNDKRACLSLSVDEWEQILIDDVEHVEFIAKDRAQVFAITRAAVKQQAKQVNTFMGWRMLIPLSAFDIVGAQGRVVREHAVEAEQLSLV